MACLIPYLKARCIAAGRVKEQRILLENKASTGTDTPTVVRKLENSQREGGCYYKPRKPGNLGAERTSDLLDITIHCPAACPARNQLCDSCIGIFCHRREDLHLMCVFLQAGKARNTGETSELTGSVLCEPRVCRVYKTTITCPRSPRSHSWSPVKHACVVQRHQPPIPSPPPHVRTQWLVD